MLPPHPKRSFRYLLLRSYTTNLLFELELKRCRNFHHKLLQFGFEKTLVKLFDEHLVIPSNSFDVTDWH